MLRDIIAMIAIQSPDGMLFGTARKFDGETLHCEIDAEILPGTLVEWRMELPGLDDTALGKMRIIGVQRMGNAGVRMWSGTIVAVDEEDDEVFSVWKRGVDEGSRSFAKSRHSGGQVDWLSGQAAAGASPAERARAMAQQDERRKRRAERARQLAKNAKAWPDPDEREVSAVVGQEMFRSRLSGSVSDAHPVNISGSRTKSLSASIEYSRPRAKVAETLREHMRRGHDADSARQPAIVPVSRPGVPMPQNVDLGPTVGSPSPVSQPVSAPAPRPNVGDPRVGFDPDYESAPARPILSPEEIAAAAKAAGVRGGPRDPEPSVAPAFIEPVVEPADDPPSQPPAFIGGIADAVERVKARSQNKRSKAKEGQAPPAAAPPAVAPPVAEPVPPAVAPPVAEPVPAEAAPTKASPKRSARAKAAATEAGSVAKHEPDRAESDVTVTPDSRPRAGEPPRDAAVPPVAAGAAAAASAAPAKPASVPSDPMVHVDKGMLSIWFVSAAAYRSQLAGLRAGRIELLQDGLGVPGMPIQVYLRVPSGVVLPLLGSVIFSGGGMTGLRLNLDASSQKLVEMG